MSKRAIVVLAAIAAILVGYILVFERESPTSKELDERKGRVLTSFVRARVDRLELQRRNTKVVLERKRSENGDELGDWTVLEPYAAKADQDAVDQVLGELEWLSPRRTLENLSAEDEKRFGLDAPRYRVWYAAGGDRHLLTLGDPDVHGEGVYARIDREPTAYVVPKTLTEALAQEPGHFRSKDFLGDITISWARSIELVDAGQTHVLRKDGYRWWLEDAPKTYADAKRVDALLAALDDLKAARYVEPAAVAAAEADLSKPARTLRVRIMPDEGREDREPYLVELRVGGPCVGQPGERVARAGEKGPPVCVRGADLKALEPVPGELRQASLLGADPSLVEGFELSRGSTKLVLKRDGEKWAAEGDVSVDRESVERWLSDLAEEKALAFLPLGAFAERGRLTLALSGDKKEQISLGGPTPDGALLVRRGDEPALVTYPESLGDKLEPSKRRFASLEPWASHQPSAVSALSARDGQLERSLVLEQGAWRTAPGAPELPDTLRVRELVKALIKLRLASFVAEQPRAEFGLSPTTARVVLQLDATHKALKLEIGAPTAHGAYARVDDGPVVEVDRQTLALVRELSGGKPEPLPDAGAVPELDHDEHDGHDEPGQFH